MRRLVVLLVLLAASDCDNPFASDETLRLSITGPERAEPGHGQYPSGMWRVECDVDLLASARGGGEGISAVWTGATLQWHRASDSALSTTERLTQTEAAELSRSCTARKNPPLSLSKACRGRPAGIIARAPPASAHRGPVSEAWWLGGAHRG